MTTFKQQAAERRNQYLRAVETIRNRTDLTPVGRQQQIARAYTTLRADLENLKKQETATGDSRRASLESKYFGLPLGSGTTESISYRDASDRVRAMDNEQDAVTLMRQANLTNDTILARATLAHAYTQQWVDVINEWEGAHREAAPELQELWDLQHGNGRGGIFDDVIYAIKPPRELNDIPERMWRELADAAS